MTLETLVLLCGPMKILQDEVCEVPTPCLESFTTLTIISGGFLVLPWSDLSGFLV